MLRLSVESASDRKTTRFWESRWPDDLDLTESIGYACVGPKIRPLYENQL